MATPNTHGPAARPSHEAREFDGYPAASVRTMRDAGAIDERTSIDRDTAINILRRHGIDVLSRVPRSHIVTVTPEIVDALLALNTNNRKVRRAAVMRLVADLDEERWFLTASGIGVDYRGVLSDGQHRLIAFREAGYPPAQFVVVTGLDPVAQTVVDRHAKRSLADALSLVRNRSVSTRVVAVCNLMLAVRGALEPRTPFSIRSAGFISDGRVAAMLVEWQDDIEAVAQAAGDQRASVTTALAVYYRHDPDGALALAEQIRRGLELVEDDPAYRLRAMLKVLVKSDGSTGRLRVFQYTVGAVVAHARGTMLKQLKGHQSWIHAPWRPWMIDSPDSEPDAADDRPEASGPRR